MKKQLYHPHRYGLTYIELVTSLAISTILLLGLSSAVLIGSKAIPTGTEQIHAEANVKQAIDLLAYDLELATGLSSVTPKSFVLAVPDRDGDTAAEAIGYEFDLDSNTLYRKWNGDTREVLLENVIGMTIAFRVQNARAYSVSVEMSVDGIANETQFFQVDLFNAPEVR